MIAWILDRAKERSTWMGLFSLAGAVGLADIPQMTSKSAEIVPAFHRQGNCIPFAGFVRALSGVDTLIGSVG